MIYFDDDSGIKRIPLFDDGFVLQRVDAVEGESAFGAFAVEPRESVFGGLVALVAVRQHRVSRDSQRVASQFQALSLDSTVHVVVLGAPTEISVGKSVEVEKMSAFDRGHAAENRCGMNHQQV